MTSVSPSPSRAIPVHSSPEAAHAQAQSHMPRGWEAGAPSADALAALSGIWARRKQTARWVPRRLLLINWWKFAYQEFHLADGHLVLNGRNGSGKSTVGAVAVPVALDMVKHRRRFDPFGGSERNPAYLLIGAWDAPPHADEYHDDRTGYVCWEFQHRVSEATVTCGVGFRARRALGRDGEIEHWGFVVSDRTHGVDFSVFAESGEPLGRSALAQRLGAGHVFVRARDYQSAMNDALFGFDRSAQLRELTDVLLELRKPKLEKGITPEQLNASLSAALPPLPTSVTEQLSDLVTGINHALEQVRETEDHLSRATVIHEAQGAAALAHAQLEGVELLELQTLVDQGERALDRKRTDRQEAEERLDRVTVRLRLLDEERTAAERRQEVLRNSAIYSQLGQLEVARRQLHEADERALAATRAVEHVTADIARVEERQDRLAVMFRGSVSERETDFDEMGTQAAATRWSYLEPLLAAARMRLASVTLMAPGPGADVVLDAMDFPGLRAKWTVRQSALEHAAAAADRVASAAEAHRQARQHADGVAARRATAAAQARDAGATLATAAEALAAAVRAWSADQTRLGRLGDDETVRRALAEALEAVSARLSPHNWSSGIAPTRHEALSACVPVLRKAREGMETSRETAQASRVEAVQLRDRLAADHQRLLDTPLLAPDARSGQTALRSALGALGLPVLPLYLALDIADGADQVRAARIEAALLEAGLLDALIVSRATHDRLTSMVASGSLPPEAADRWVVVEERTHAGQSVAAPAPPSRVVSEILHASTEVFTPPAMASLLVALDRVVSHSVDGRWRHGMLFGWAGSTHSSGVRFLGEGNRRRHRAEAIAALATRLESAQSLVDEYDAALAALNERLQALRASADRLEALDAAGQYETAWHQSRIMSDLLARLDIEVLEADRAAQAVRVTLVAREEELRVAIAPIPDCSGITASALRDELRDERAVVREIEHLRTLLAELVRQRGDAESLAADLEAARGRLEETRLEQEAALEVRHGAEARVAAIEAILTSREAAQLRAEIAQLVQRLAGIVEERDPLKEEKGSWKNKVDQLSDAMQELEGDLLTRRGSRDEQALRLVATLQRYPHPELIRARDIAQLADEGAGPVGAARELLKRRRTTQDLRRNVNEDRNSTFNHLHEAFTTHKEALAAYRPEWIGGEARVRFIDPLDHQQVAPDRLVAALERQRDEQRRAVSERETELYEQFFIGDVISTVRQRIADAHAFVAHVGHCLAGMRLSNGSHFTLTWQPKAAVAGGADYGRLINLVRLDPEAMTTALRQEMIALFRSRVDVVRHAADFQDAAAGSLSSQRANGRTRRGSDRIGGESLAERLHSEFDYRGWFDFKLTFVRPDGTTVALMKNGLQALSGGERTLAQVLPLLAAVHAHSLGARPDAPKLIYLDEAFAGVDPENTEGTLRMLSELDFSWLFASDKFWGTSREISASTTYTLTPGSRAVFAMFHLWDGDQTLSESELASLIARHGPLPYAVSSE